MKSIARIKSRICEIYKLILLIHDTNVVDTKLNVSFFWGKQKFYTVRKLLMLLFLYYFSKLFSVIHYCNQTPQLICEHLQFPVCSYCAKLYLVSYYCSIFNSLQINTVHCHLKENIYSGVEKVLYEIHSNFLLR